MNLIETSETIELWINSCRTHEQLDLLYYGIDNFINRERFPHEHYAMVDGAVLVMKDKINFNKDRIKFEKPSIANEANNKDY